MRVANRSACLGAARLFVLPALLLSACTGEISGVYRTDSSGTGTGATTGGPITGAGTTGGSTTTAGGGATGTGPTPPAMCVSTTPAPGPSPLRRLTHREYNNTLRQLLGDTTDPGASFAPEEQVLGFDNNAEARGVASLLAEQYMNAAEQIAARAAKDLPKLMGCTPADATAMAESTCATQFIQNFGKRAFRRPLQTNEVTRLTSLYATSRDKYGFPMAVELVLEAMLQSPSFLYRVELGAPAAGKKVVSLGPWDIASRLSFLLWGSMPDDELFGAAEAGQLSTKEQIASQVARMMKDDRVSGMLADFHRQWLELDKIDTVEKDPAAVAGFTDDLRPLLKQETQTLVSSILASDKPDLRSLLTAPYTFMNAKLAAFYGVQGPATSAFERVALDPSQRIGILTQGSVLTVHAHANQTSPVHRGLFVRRQVLCNPPPPPPANVVVMIPPPDPTLTTRERFARHSAEPYCASCHSYLDPIGLGFETFDPVGRVRTAENGHPIDPTGNLAATDVDGKFVGAAELANKLAGSEQVASCVVTEWFRYAYGRDEDDTADACSKALLDDRFAKSGQNIRELLLALTQTDAFLYRSVSEGEMP